MKNFNFGNYTDFEPKIFMKMVKIGLGVFTKKCRNFSKHLIDTQNSLILEQK